MSSAQKTYHIYFDEAHQIVVMEWNGYATTEQFREGTELMLNLLIRHRCTKVLADTRRMTLISMDDQQWLERTFLPRAIQFGFEKIAILLPTSYFNKVAIANISSKIDRKKLNMHFFEAADDAFAWLAD